MADQPLSPATDRRLGKPLPYQLANQTRAHLKAINLYYKYDAIFNSVCGISSGFPKLFPTLRQIAHALLTRSPLERAQHTVLLRLIDNEQLIIDNCSLSFTSCHLTIALTTLNSTLKQCRSPPRLFIVNCQLFIVNCATLCVAHVPVRLACVRHAASVRPEPGSNSLLKLFQTMSSDIAQVLFQRRSFPSLLKTFY